MALTECANGHLYDTTQYESCPYCQGDINRVEFVAPNGSIGKTVGFDTPNVNMMVNTPEIGATVAPAVHRGQMETANGTGKTVAVLQKNMKIEPIVGWIVCVEGADKGKDYRILAKNNTIGRSEKMDICIKGDTTISRENHAKIAYDMKHNMFHIIPGDSTNLIYVNDMPIYVPTEIIPYDLIELGDSKFVFVPFCTNQFNWQDGLVKGQ